MNSDSSGVEKNTHAQIVQMQRMLFAKLMKLSEVTFSHTKTLSYKVTVLFCCFLVCHLPCCDLVVTLLRPGVICFSSENNWQFWEYRLFDLEQEYLAIFKFWGTKL